MNSIEDNSGTEVDLSMFQFDRYVNRTVGVTAAPIPFPIRVYSHGWETKGDKDDWLVMAPKGILFCCPQSVFKALYEKTH
jgi:hypothetical protein